MKLLTPSQVARKLQVKPATVLRWARQGRLPSVMLGRRTARFSVEEIDRVLAQSQRGQEPDTKR